MGEKVEKIRDFILQRIGQIDEEYAGSTDSLERLKIITQRECFSKILSSYLNDQEQLAFSYHQHAKAYLEVKCYDQAIQKAMHAKKYLPQNDRLLESSHLIIFRCLAEGSQVEEAKDYIKEFTPLHYQEEYYHIVAQVMEKVRDQKQTNEALSSLENIIQGKYGSSSVEMGLFLIEKGKKKGSFGHYKEALRDLNKGMNILIELKHKNHFQIGKIYLVMASFNKKIQNLDSQYSCLICSHSMMRQSTDKQKQLIEIMHRIARNLEEREEFESSLEELVKIQYLEKQIYGESTLLVSKTLKKIAETLLHLNRKAEAKKYEQEYLRIVGSNEKKGPIKQLKSKSNNLSTSVMMKASQLKRQ